MGNLYVADTGNHTVRLISPAGQVTTLAGKPGIAGIALGALPGGLDFPIGVALADASTLVVTSGHSVLRLVTR